MAAFSCNICGQGFDFGECRCDSMPEPLPAAQAPLNSREILGLLTEDIAKAFVSILRKTVGEEDYKRIVDMNAVELNPDVCNSGDFCDSNMVMDAAFRQNGLDPCPDVEEGMSQASVDLWNSAWERAKQIMQGH